VVHLAKSGWLQDRRGAPEITLVDPRSRNRYLSGHIPKALSVPITGAFGPDGRLLADDALADWLGRSGVSTEGTVVVYGDSDGQSAAMLAWVLEYLGHPDVAILPTRFERWKDLGGEVSYRPVVATPTTFTARPRSELRATWEDAATPGSQCLLDARSQEEYRGDKVVAHDQPGHIPGALNLPWLAFVGEDAELLVDSTQVVSRLRSAGVETSKGTVVYGRSGCMRASVAWLAIQLAGSQARLYDGSFLDWSQRGGLPIETGDAAQKQPTRRRRSGASSTADKKSVRRASRR
jgi:thiosulfate/3-mercaptopyruvate sulfurtransferase